MGKPLLVVISWQKSSSSSGGIITTTTMVIYRSIEHEYTHRDRGKSLTSYLLSLRLQAQSQPPKPKNFLVVISHAIVNTPPKSDLLSSNGNDSRVLEIAHCALISLISRERYVDQHRNPPTSTRRHVILSNLGFLVLSFSKVMIDVVAVDGLNV